MDEKPDASQPSRLRERIQLVLAVLFGLVAGISCMSIGIGNKIADPTVVEVSATGTLKQEGTFNPHESPQGLVDVYYPRAYVSPPNLRLSSNHSFHQIGELIELVDQKPDHFTFRPTSRAKGGFPDITYRWVAEGVPTALNQAVLISPAPTEPIPVGPAVFIERGK